MIDVPTNKAPKSRSQDFVDKDVCEPASKNMHKQDKQACKGTTNA